MKQVKHFFLLFVLMSMVGAQAFAYDAEIDGIYYKLSDNGAEVTRNKDVKYVGEVKIPSSVTYNGKTYSVTSIDNYAFYGCSGLTSIEIPSSVTSIGSSAFRGCVGLTSIEIPNSVTSIGGDAFYATPWYNNKPDGLVYAGKVAYKYKGTMPSGTSIVLEEGTKGIGGGAFYDCSGLISIEIPSSVMTIPSSAFYGCTDLTSIKIPNSVTSIDPWAFRGCTGLTSIEIPRSVTLIWDDAFIGCSGLTSITVESGNPFYDSRNNCNAIILTNTNTLIAGCKNTVIPNSVTTLSYTAFYGCSSLTSIKIPKSVMTIPSSAFWDCPGLTSIIVESGNTVYDSRNNCNAIIETNSNTLINGCKNTVIPNSVTSIGGGAFYGCSSLTSIEIPNNVTTIGIEAFLGCDGLTSVTIGTSNFSNCFIGLKNLQSVTLLDGVTTIGIGAFENCSNLTSIEIPNSVTSIGGSAFRGCVGLTSIEIPNSVTTIRVFNVSFYN